MIMSPARNFVISVAAGFLFNLSFMASIIIVYEKVSHVEINYIACVVYSGILVRLLRFHGATHSATDNTDCDRDTNHILTSCRPDR